MIFSNSNTDNHVENFIFEKIKLLRSLNSVVMHQCHISYNIYNTQSYNKVSALFNEISAYLLFVYTGLLLCIIVYLSVICCFFAYLYVQVLYLITLTWFVCFIFVSVLLSSVCSFISVFYFDKEAAIQRNLKLLHKKTVGDIKLWFHIVNFSNITKLVAIFFSFFHIFVMYWF